MTFKKRTVNLKLVFNEKLRVRIFTKKNYLLSAMSVLVTNLAIDLLINSAFVLFHEFSSLFRNDLKNALHLKKSLIWRNVMQ
jgi:hypothetical protein